MSPDEPAHPVGETRPPAASVTDPPRRALVLSLIVLTTAVFLALFAVLFVRWAREREPSSTLIVSVTPAFAGAEIIVQGVTLPSTHRAIAAGHDGEVIPFYLDRGMYSVRVVRGGKTIQAGEIILQPNEQKRVDLGPLGPLLPATAPSVLDVAAPVGK